MALDAAAAVGPFFTVRIGPPLTGGGPRAEGYVPLAEAYGPLALSGLRWEAYERTLAARPSGAAATSPPAGDPAGPPRGRMPDAPGRAAAGPGGGRTVSGGPHAPAATGAAVPGTRSAHATDEVSGAVPPAVLVRRIGAVLASTGTGERRVAASLAFQGLAARLWSIALGPAALIGQVPGLHPDTVWWNPDRTAPEDLWLPEPATPAPGAGDAARLLRATVLHAHLLPLHRATLLSARVSGALLWGNAASALAGSLRVLHGWCLAEGRPEAAERARTVVTALLGAPPLREAGHWRRGPERDFRRHSCCLYYRVPGGGLCGDCALRRPPARPD